MTTDANLKLHLSYGPHIKRGQSTTSIMWLVNVSLIPALLWAFFIFGWPVLLICLSSILGAYFAEQLVCSLRKQKSTLPDGSAFCSGLLLAYTLPPGIPIWMPFVGSFLGMIFTKGLFGGLGYNIFNVALMGRAIMMATFPVAMTTTWTVPKLGGFSTDGQTMATPLAVLQERGLNAVMQLFSTLPTELNFHLKLILGLRPGCIGEVSVVFLLIGAFFLISKGIIKLYIPLSLFAGLFLVSLLSPAPTIHLFTGGIWLGAFFMATDYVTSPSMPKGQIIFGLGIGILTGVIRLWGGYPEGVCYAILLMNTLTPALDEWFPPKRVSAIGVPS